MNSPLVSLARADLGRRRSRGLTLIELMVGVAVLAVTLAVAAPQFQQWGRSTRVMAQAADLQSALAYARSESQRRAVRVTVCRSSAPTVANPACSVGAATWADGWLVFVDNTQTAGNQIGVVDGTDAVLRIGEQARGSAVATTGNVGDWLSFSPQGLVRTNVGTANGGFTVCQTPHRRRIAVSPVGIVNVTVETC